MHTVSAAPQIALILFNILNMYIANTKTQKHIASYCVYSDK